MMLASHPDFCNFKRVEYGRGRVDPTNKRVAMRVVIVTSRNETIPSIYQLVQENGAWRIDGVSTGQWPGAPQNSPTSRQRDRDGREVQPPTTVPPATSTPRAVGA
jgi:hypothetical protein